MSNTTSSIFLESAYFNPISIRKTSKRHNLNTDASFRFERGCDPNNTLFALKRAALLIKEIAGGKISSEIFDFYPNNIELLSPFVGLGHGRGYAFLFFIVGILYVGIWILNFNNKNLRNLSRQVKEITNN